MNKKPHIGLIIALMMFPQIVETIYSPVLPHLASTFGISVNTAAQTLSVYFTAFAFGVVCWGRISDLIGRRKTMLIGLGIYGFGAGLALMATDFNLILCARVISAFGAAVGSVVTQTILRDSYDDVALVKVFSIMGMGISLSPVIGLVCGGFIAEYSGHYGVSTALLVLAVILWLITLLSLPETRPSNLMQINLLSLLGRMAYDRHIWRNALLVALFNLLLFSYYSLAPFIFDSLGLSSIEFGYSGVALACGSLLGSVINKHLLQAKLSSSALLKLAGILAVTGSSGVYLSQASIWFLVPMLLVVMSFGIAIPNILAHALAQYKDAAGSAGALFGLLYYLMLGTMLAVAGIVQNLGAVLILASVLSLLCIWRRVGP
jgi:MFS family permease